MGHAVAVTTEPGDRADTWLVDLVARRAGALRSWEPLARVDAPDAVHKMRVTVRQLRSDLRTFGGLLLEGSVERLDAELGWLADVLGAVRDAEVLRARLRSLLESLEPEQVRGDVPERLAAVLVTRHEAARSGLIAAMASERFECALAEAGRLPATLKPICGSASIADAVRPCVDKASARLRKRADRAVQAPTPLALHAARRAAKRVRYGAEALIDAYGPAAVALAARAESLQDVLGEAHDAHVSSLFLLDSAAAAHVGGRDPTTLGVLAGLEEAAQRRALEAFGPLWAEARRRRHRRWLSSRT